MENINQIPIELLIKCTETSERFFNFNEIPAPLEKVISRGGASANMPLFLLAKEGEDLYLIIRGATEACDFGRVLNFAHSPFLGGEVHAGSLEAARWIIAECRKYINECKGRIICTGHSLGGATSGIIAAILRLEEKRENVIGITEAAFPVFTEDVKKLTEPFITSLVYNNDVVPLLSHKNIKTLLNSLVSPEVQGNPQMAAMMVGQMINQLIVGILASRGVNDPSVINSIGSTLPLIVSQIMAPNSPNLKDLLLPGKVFQVALTSPETFQVIPFVEGRPLPALLMLMVGVQDHNLQLLVNALKALSKPSRSETAGPQEVDDLD